MKVSELKEIRAEAHYLSKEQMKEIDDIELPTNWKPLNNLAYIKQGTDCTVIVRESGWSHNGMLSLPYKQREEYITLDAPCPVLVIDEVDPGKFLCRYTGDNMIDNFMVVPFETLIFDEWSGKDICTLQQRSKKIIDDVTQLLQD